MIRLIAEVACTALLALCTVLILISFTLRALRIEALI